MNFNFGDVLGRTWKIGWNHKVLWLWQMLPALTAIVFVPLFFISNPLFMRSASTPFNDIVSESWVSTVFSLVAFLFSVLSIFLTVVIQSTTTYGAIKIERGAEKLTFGGLFRESQPFFWRVLGLYLLFGGTWMLIWFGFMAFFMFSAMLTFGLGFICVIPLFLLLIPVLVVGYSVLELAQAAIVADNIGTLEAISQSWKLFRANWLSVILLMLILYFAFVILSSAVFLPMMFPMMMLTNGMDSSANANTFMPTFFLILSPLVLILAYAVQGTLMAFFQSAWAVAYLRLSNNADTPIISEERPIEAGI